MKPLKDTEFDTLIDLLYDSALAPDRWSPFLKALAHSFDAVGVFYGYDFEHNRTLFSNVFGLDDTVAQSFDAHYAPLNPYPAVVDTFGVNEIVYASQILDPREVTKTQFYSDFMQPYQVSVNHLGLKPVHDSGRFAILGMSPLSKSFELDPIAAGRQFERLIPHVRRSIDIGRQTAKALDADRLGADLLESFSSAAFLIDGRQRIVHLNRRAEALLKNRKLLRCDPSGRLRTTAVGDDGKFASLFAHQPGIARLTEVDTGRRFNAWTVRVPRRRSLDAYSAFLLGPAQPVASTLLLIAEADHTAVIPAPIIQSVFGLTPAEAKLVAALVAGSTLGEYANQSELSLRTARNQLSGIFAKLGVTRQAELIALVIRSFLTR